MLEANQRTTGSMLMESFNPMSMGFQYQDLKWHYLHRGASKFSRLATSGISWTGLYGFRTLASGTRGAIKEFGAGYGGPGSRLVQSFMNRTIGSGARALGKMFNVDPLRTWGVGIGEGYGLLGSAEQLLAEKSTTRGWIAGTRKFLGGTPGAFDPGIEDLLTKQLGQEKAAQAMRSVEDIISKQRTWDLLTKRSKFGGPDVGPRSATRVGGLREHIYGRLMTDVKGIGSGTAYKAVNKISWWRTLGQRWLPRVSTAANVLLAMQVFSSLAHAGTNLVFDTARRLSNISLTREMFGGGKLPGAYQTQPAATMRRRAIEELQNAKIGTRSILGNEAAMYS